MQNLQKIEEPNNLKTTKDKKGKSKSSSKKRKKKLHVVPENAAAVSSNWEKLKQTLPPPKKKIKVNSQKQSQNQLQKKPEVWFDDVDEILLDEKDEKEEEEEEKKISDNKDPSSFDVTTVLVKARSFKGITRVIAMDCEMAGVGTDGKDSILGRVSIVNHFGQCIYDKYVKPTEKVTDYRTQVSGLRPQDLENGEDFKIIQKEVSDILDGRILVGHAIHNDLKVLFLQHPKSATRDTSKYKPFRKIFGGKNPSLKRLTEAVLGVKVQAGEHNSVQDAQAAMRLYTMHRKKWEESDRIGKKKPKWKVRVKKKKKK